MITSLTLSQKQDIINSNIKELMTHHLCGNYIDMTDINCGCIEWCINETCNDTFTFFAFTDYGTYSHEYDFDFSFDSNLQTFVECLRDYLLKQEG